MFFKLYPKRKEEYNNILTDASILLISTLLLILVFPKDIAILSMILFTFVDVGEQIFGITFPSERLPWNDEKNVAGTLAGFFVAVIVGALSIFFMGLGVPFDFLLPVSAVAAVAGTSKKHDNIVIEWSSAILLVLLSILF